MRVNFCDVKSHVDLNLIPMLSEVKSRLKTLRNLAFSLIGGIDLFKMKVLLKFLYLFRNPPTWIPKSFFKELMQIVLFFPLGPQVPRYKLATLTRPTSQGGLAISDFYKYFIVTQLVTAHWWLEPNLSNPSVMLEAAMLNSLEALKLPIP